MTTIYHDADADLGALDGRRVAVVGYGNQGRSWALNLRDSGLDVTVVRPRRRHPRGRPRPTASRRGPRGGVATPTSICVLVPDDVIPTLPLDAEGRRARRSWPAATRSPFDRFDPACDVGMVAPRMLGPEVRRCYEEGVGFITAVGVHRDVTGHALGADARGRQGHRRPAPGRDRADPAAGGGARPRRRAGAVAGAAPRVAVVRAA